MNHIYIYIIILFKIINNISKNYIKIHNNDVINHYISQTNVNINKEHTIFEIPIIIFYKLFYYNYFQYLVYGVVFLFLNLNLKTF